MGRSKGKSIVKRKQESYSREEGGTENELASAGYRRKVR